MRLHRWSFICCAAAAAMLGASSARAAIVLSEDFEGIDVSGGPVAVTTENSVFTLGVANGTFLARNENPPLLQGAGTNPFTGSNYLHYGDGDQAALMRAPVALNGGFVLSFDYFEPNETAGTATALRVLLSNGETGTSSGANGVRAVELNLNVDNGAATGTLHSIGTAADATVNPFVNYNGNELIHIDVVGNLGAGTASYGGDGTGFPTSTVDQFRYDVYVNGALAIEAAGFRNAHSQITEFALASHPTGSRVQDSYIDNIVIQNALPVPEPASLSLVGVGIVVAVAARGRFGRRNGKA